MGRSLLTIEVADMHSPSRRVVVARSGVSWAGIGEAVGHGDIATTARHYTHVLSDGSEVGYSGLIGRS